VRRREVINGLTPQNRLAILTAKLRRAKGEPDDYT